jgi:hypothetical protein
VQLRLLSSEDAVVSDLRTQAAKAVEASEFERAEALLNQASDCDLEAAKKLKEVEQKRLLSAAASSAVSGDMRYTQCAPGAERTKCRSAQGQCVNASARLWRHRRRLILPVFEQTQGLISAVSFSVKRRSRR